MVAIDEQFIEQTSHQYVGRWNRLISTTNWEKGRIILQWRSELIERDAPATEYSDEAWARHVGGVSSQHVGRLRRVAERFADARDGYEGLFWSHFQATLDWDDAEMWLEGAVQNAWSVKQMINQRWETLGAPADLKPRDEDIITGDTDEDVDAGLDGSPAADRLTGDSSIVYDPDADADDDEDDDCDAPFDDEHESASRGAAASAAAETQESARARPFADLASLPDDLADAMESFKLAIVRHKLAGWQEVERDDVLAALEALKTLCRTEA